MDRPRVSQSPALAEDLAEIMARTARRAIELVEAYPDCRPRLERAGAIKREMHRKLARDIPAVEGYADDYEAETALAICQRAFDAVIDEWAKGARDAAETQAVPPALDRQEGARPRPRGT
jgi:hypothetical protein